MNRLTKQIGLVLISSSLVLCGCSEPEDQAEADEPNSQYPPSGASNNTWHSTPGGSVYHGGYYGSPGSFPGGGSFSSHSSGSSFSHSSGSVRGGFGATGHGAGS